MHRHLKLTDTQLMLLSKASQRDDHRLIVPETLKGGAARAVLSKLLTHSLVEEIEVGHCDPSWRRDEHEQPIGLKVTRAGLEAIGIESDAEASSALHLSESGNTSASPVPDSEAPRATSKRALVIKLLHREDGASLEDLMQSTGWLPHTTRAALTVLRQRGYEIVRAKGEGGQSVYRLTRIPDQAGHCLPAAAEA